MLTVNSLHDTQQPLYYLLLKLQHFFFEISTVVQARFISICIGITSIFVNYKVIKNKFDSEIALTSTSFLSLSFIAIHHTNEVRMYSLMLFLSIISLHYVYLIIDRYDIKIKCFLIFTIIQILMAYTHHFGFLACFTNVSCIVGYQFRKGKLNWKLALGFIVLFLIFVFPIATDFVKDFNDNHLYRDAITLKLLLGQLSYLFSGKFFFLVSVIVMAWLLMKHRQCSFLYILVGLPVAITYFKSVMFSPSLESRYLIFVLPAFFLCLSQAIHLFAYKRTLYLILIICSVLNIFLKENYFDYPYRLDSKGISERVIKFYMETKSKEIIFCNTCPNFYLKNYKISCLFHEYERELKPMRSEDIWVVLEAKQNACSQTELEKKGLKIFLNDKKLNIKIYKFI